jgi:hypothetical protein
VLSRPATAIVSQNAQSWFWNSDTNAASITTGDVTGDGQAEIVTAGYWNDGLYWNALLHVWNASTLASINVVTWRWANDTNAVSVAVGDVVGDGRNEIVTGGTYFDGTRWIAQLHVWNGTTLTPLNVVTWYWTSNTQISSIAIGDVDGDGRNEIVTGGTYFDNTRYVAQLHVWNGSTLAVERVQTWFWNSNTNINSVAVGNFTGGTGLEIVTGGAYFDGTRYVAQLHVWNGSTLAVEKVQTWFWAGDTNIASVAIASLTGGTSQSIVTGGSFNDGTRNNAQLFIWNPSTPTLTVQSNANWFTTSNTTIASIAVGNFTGGTSLDIITGGTFNDGVRNNAQVVDFNSTTLVAQSAANWFQTSNTEINSVALGTLPVQALHSARDHSDNTRSVAQLTIWS